MRLHARVGGQLVGYLSLKDITHVLALHGLGQDAAPGATLRDARRPLRRAA